MRTIWEAQKDGQSMQHVWWRNSDVEVNFDAPTTMKQHRYGYSSCSVKKNSDMNREILVGSQGSLLHGLLQSQNDSFFISDVN